MSLTKTIKRMTIGAKLKALVFSVLFLIFAESVIFYQEFFWTILVSILTAFALSFLWFLGPDLFIRKKIKLAKSLLPFLLIASATFFFLFENNIWFCQIVVALVIVAIWFFMRVYHLMPPDEAKSSDSFLVFEKIFPIVLFCLFLASWVIWNFYYNLAWPLWAPMIIWFLVVLLLFYYLFWFAGLLDEVSSPASFLTAIVLVEIFLVLAFWYCDPYIKSFILTISAFGVGEVLFLIEKSALTQRKIWWIILVLGVLLGIILKTIVWVRAI